MSFVLPAAEIGAQFRQNGLCGHDVDAINAGQVYTADSLQLGVQIVIKPGRTCLRQTSLSGCKRKIRSWECQGSPVAPKSLEKVSQSLLWAC